MARLLPPGAREQFVEHSSGRLRVLHAGTPHPGRAPVVLVHGGGSDNSAISWYRLIDPLSSDREVWAVDLPGSGGSIAASPVGGPDALADVVASVMTTSDLEPAVAAGVSMGGDVVLNLALRHPHLVAGLIPIAAGGLIPVWRNRTMHLLAWLSAQSPDWMLLPATRLGNRFVSTVLRTMVRDLRTIPPEVVAEFAREAGDPRSAIAYLRYNQATLGAAGMRNDVTPRVHEITAPTLLFHGDSDPLVPLDGSRDAAERISGARLVIAPECGHWAQLEAHDLFLAGTVDFLERLDRRIE